VYIWSYGLSYTGEKHSLFFTYNSANEPGYASLGYMFKVSQRLINSPT